MCAFYQDSLLLADWMSKEGLEKGWIALSFPFLLCYHFQQKLLASRKDDERISWLFFLEHHCLLSALEASAGSYSKHGLSRLSALPAYSAVHATHVACTRFEFHWSPMHHRSTGIPFSSSIKEAICEGDGKEQQWTCTLHIGPFAHVHAPLSPLTLHKLKGEIIKNFKVATTET